MTLGPLGRCHVGQIGAQVGVGVHALVAHPGDQRVQHVDGRAGIVEGAVRGRGRGAEQRGQCGELDAGCLVTGEHPAGQLDGAQDRRFGPGQLMALGRSPQEPDVETRVVGHQHRSAAELEKRRQHRVDPRGVVHHRRGDPGERDDLRRDVATRVDEGRELTQDLAAAHLHRADLGDRVVPVTARPAARGLEIDHHEGGLPQGRAGKRVGGRVDVGEAQLTHGLNVGGPGDKSGEAGRTRRELSDPADTVRSSAIERRAPWPRNSCRRAKSRTPAR